MSVYRVSFCKGTGKILPTEFGLILACSQYTLIKSSRTLGSKSFCYRCGLKGKLLQIAKLYTKSCTRTQLLTERNLQNMDFYYLRYQINEIALLENVGKHFPSFNRRKNR